MPSLAQFRAVPNLLTLLRLFILPFLVIQILDGRWVIAAVLFVLAVFDESTPFHATLEELANDRERLLP